MKNLYELDHVVFNYDGNILLDDINIKIDKSSIVGIVGPNGSGKTTLLKLLSFLNFPHYGRFYYDGTELMKNNINQFRKSIGYVQQDPYLFRGTVYKNIEIGLKLNHINQKIREKKVSKILSLLNIEHLSTRLAHLLSGGETKKVAIGQAMILEPDVLIMDEPFSSLDKDSIYELEELITLLRAELNKTIIFTTHDQVQAQKLTDHIYTIVRGKLFPTHLINLFSGKFDKFNKVFDTGKQLIRIDNDLDNLELIAIDPRQIVLSLQELDSSMQNSFLGKITGIIEDSSNIKLNIDIGEKIQAIITRKAFSDLKLSLSMNVWVSFKSSSIMIF